MKKLIFLLWVPFLMGFVGEPGQPASTEKPTAEMWLNAIGEVALNFFLIAAFIAAVIGVCHIIIWLQDQKKASA